MRFLILVRTSPEFEADPTPEPPPELLAAMAEYHEALAKAGVLVDANGLHPSRAGWRQVYAADGTRRIVDGPFPDSRELVSGYTLIDVPTAEEAMAWSRRYPNPAGEGRAGAIEVRRVHELDDFTPGPEIDRFRALDAAPAKPPRTDVPPAR